MDAVGIIVGSGWTLTGFVMIALAVPLIRRRVGRNGLYGIRLPQSFESDDAWYAINHYGGKRLVVWAIPLILVGVACFFLPLQRHIGLALTAGFAPLIFVLVPGLEAWRFARHYRPGS